MGLTVLFFVLSTPSLTFQPLFSSIQKPLSLPTAANPQIDTFDGFFDIFGILLHIDLTPCLPLSCGALAYTANLTVSPGSTLRLNPNYTATPAGSLEFQVASHQLLLKSYSAEEMNRALDKFEVRPSCPWEDTAIEVTIQVTPSGGGDGKHKWGQRITTDIGKVTQVDGNGTQTVMKKSLRY